MKRYSFLSPALLLSGMLLFDSCELIVDVDVPAEPPTIVMNGLQRNDSTWSIFLSDLRPILSNVNEPFKRINGAVVSVTGDDGTNITLTEKASSYYKHPSAYPKPGATYTIRTSAEGYPAVEARMKMPEVVPIIDIEWDSSGVTPPSKYYTAFNLPFTIRFRDPAGEKNYYSVNVHTYVRKTYYDQVTGEKIVQNLVISSAIWLRDPAVVEEEEGFVWVWEDDTFDGEEYVANLEARMWKDQTQEVQKVEVTLLNVSREQYDYLRTAILSGDVQGDPFAQPVPVYTNVSQGLGIVAGSSRDKVVYTRP